MPEVGEVALVVEQEQVAVLLQVDLVAEAAQLLDRPQRDPDVQLVGELGAEAAGGLRRRPRGERVALEQDDPADAELAEVPGDRGTHRAPADDDDVGRLHARTLVGRIGHVRRSAERDVSGARRQTCRDGTCRSARPLLRRTSVRRTSRVGARARLARGGRPSAALVTPRGVAPTLKPVPHPPRRTSVRPPPSRANPAPRRRARASAAAPRSSALSGASA